MLPLHSLSLENWTHYREYHSHNVSDFDPINSLANDPIVNPNIPPMANSSSSYPIAFNATLFFATPQPTHYP